MNAQKNYRVFIVVAVIAMLCFWQIAYHIPRTNFGILILLIAVLFIGYGIMMARDFAQVYFKELVVLSLAFRLIFIVAIPSLSDDYFRFIWDGALTNNAINPYLYVPASVNELQGTALPELMIKLKAGMNSLSYYSPYPPVLQSVFFVAVKFGGYHLLNNLIIIRILALIAEAGTLFTVIKILDHFKLDRHRVVWYGLNPLVIIELAGNLHGEVFLIVFMVLSFYLLIKNYYFFSALLLGLAVSTKLLPLIFIPAIISYTGFQKGMVYSLMVMITVMVSFLPFLDGVFIQHIAESIGYYFQKFEFNASIYYILRWIGYDFTGFNLIYFFGILLPCCAFVVIVWIAFYKPILTPEILIERLLYSLLVYYLFSLIVHPWYITVLVVLSVFTAQRFALIWSAVIMLTYSTYIQTPYHEILWVTALEYLVLGSIIYLEYRKKNKVQFF